MKKKIELMAPVGNFAMLTAVCKAGADAIYFGLSDFTMRVGKRNFNISDLVKIKKICDSYPRKPKMYLVLNTIVYDKELKKLESLIKKVKDKVDAVICWDIAVIRLCKEHKVTFFISTQASVSNMMSAEFYKKLGAKRIVLARELTLPQVKKIAKIKGVEIEVFIHGAMCVSISGRCLISQFLYNKSANRGECFQPCRRSYTVRENKYGNELEVESNTIFSAKDLCTLPFIEELKRSGVNSFKIEGRNRDPRYAECVVRVYREAIDNKLNKERIKDLISELESVYNKGFSSGFYLGKPIPSDFSIVENSASPIYKEFIGKSTHFYPKVGAVSIKLVKNLKEGDDIVFIGEKIGSYQLKVLEMELKNKRVISAKKGQEITVKSSFIIPSNSEVYKLKRKK